MPTIDMPRRASLPPHAFNNSNKRDRRLSAPPPPPPLPAPRRNTRGFVRVQVADFVTVPHDRLSQSRNALGPVDLAKRPPCYDLRPAVNSEHHLALEDPDRVFEISDRQHIDTLRTILTARQDSLSDETVSATEDHQDIEQSAHKQVQLQPEQQPEEQPEGHSEDHSQPIHNSEYGNLDGDSDKELMEEYDDLREYDDQSQLDEEVDPDLDFDDGIRSASFVMGSIVDTSITSNLLSTSSVADTSLSEFPTIASINTTDGTSETPSSVPLEDEQPYVFVAVESSECTTETKKALPSFMRKKVPSPVKYTFRPLHKVPSQVGDEPVSTEVTEIVPSAWPARWTEDITRGSDASSEAHTNDEPLSTKSPTLAAVKNIVDKIDPHAAIGIVHVPPLALATVGFFRKKRDSEESIWSRKSDASSRKKRESDESTQSSNTEYYEDEYTKFIEKKNSSPRSPLRLRNHPYFAKIAHADDGVKFSRPGFRRHSSVSVSTSDEEYIPLSDVTRCSDVS